MAESIKQYKEKQAKIFLTNIAPCFLLINCFAVINGKTGKLTDSMTAVQK